MATVVFTYNHARDPMHPGDLGGRITASLSLAAFPVVDISATQIVVTHPNVTEANRVAIQALINAYVLDPAWTALTNDLGGYLRSKATTALTANSTFLALASPTAAQQLAQLKLLTRENNALVRLLLGLLDSAADT